MSFEKLLDYVKTTKPEELKEELQVLRRIEQYVVPSDKKNLFKKTDLVTEDGTPVLQTPAQQKDEKIEKMAWEFYMKASDPTDNYYSSFTQQCFDHAERFCEFVKKKQEEANDTDNSEN
jgi:hypothetical protein